MGAHIVLSGFMATGKSALAPVVAERAGLPWVDIDAVIAAQQGETVGQVWQRLGERGFRALEAEIAAAELRHEAPRVIACGGGTLLDRGTRHLALDRAVVVTLTASPEVIAARAGDLSTRPNLASSDPASRARDLLALRADAYAECHGSFATDDVGLDALADAVLALVARAPIAVPLGTRSYVVDVTRDQPWALTDAIAQLAPSSLVVVTDAHVYRAQQRRIESALGPLAAAGSLITLSPGEPNKNLAAVQTIWESALGAGIDRDAVVVAFGGGVVGDLAGFAAATLLRGLRIVQAPTTLLAMVDSSVGGKTGFDVTAGKNLVGALYQPCAVVADLATLATLPPRELRAGLAEVVKVALAFDPTLLEHLESHAAALASGAPQVLAPVVRRAIELKAEIVRDDETDTGRRALLNFGHTFGHALEAAGAYRDYLHGEAVAAGIMRELAFTTRRGWTPPGLAERASRLLATLGVSPQVPAARWAAAAGYLGKDKKRAGDDVRLPALRGAGVASIERVALADLVADCKGSEIR
jgi:shikimate kinase/3-dehydroquinate synthase